MLRKITMAILITFCAIMQTMVFQIFEIASVKPNLLLIVTVSFGLMRGRSSGLLTGFASGLALDLMFPGALGYHALIYMWIGYASGYCYRIFYDDDIKMPMIMVMIAGLTYGIYEYVCMFLVRGRTNFLFYLNRIIIPETLYTLIIAVFIYRLIYRLNQWMNKSDKRSIDSLV